MEPIPFEEGTGYCETCKERVPLKWQDLGFAFDYGSIKSSTHDWVAICIECGDDLKNTERSR